MTKKSEIKKDEWLYTDINGKHTILRQKLYAYMKNELPIKITDRGNYYKFDGKVYRYISERELKALIKEYLPVEYRNKKDWSSVFDEFQTDFPDIKEEEFNADENIICFNNGILKLNTMELIKHSDEYLVTRMIPCNYLKDKTLDDAPIFKSYLEKLLMGNRENIIFIMEYIGAILSNVYGYRFKKMLILVGPGNTGKTQLRELIISLVGEENCAAIDLRKIQDRFGTATLYEKRFAGYGDMSNIEISELNIMKALTGGDAIQGEFKGKDAFTFKYRGFLGFNANALPFFRGDRGGHVYSRINIIRCDNVIPYKERDPELLEKILKEKDVIASVAITYLKDAISRGYVFTESEMMIAERKQYLINNNSLLTFIKDCCEKIGSGYVHRSDFNNIYKRWCIANQVKPERDKEIPKQLLEYFAIEAKKTNGYYVYPFNISKVIIEEYEDKKYYY